MSGKRTNLDDSRLPNLIDQLLNSNADWSQCKQRLKKELNIADENSYAREVEKYAQGKVNRDALMLYAKVLASDMCDSHKVLLDSNFRLLKLAGDSAEKDSGEVVLNNLKFGYHEKNSQIGMFSDAFQVQIRGSNVSDVELLNSNPAMMDWWKRNENKNFAVFLNFKVSRKESLANSMKTHMTADLQKIYQESKLWDETSCQLKDNQFNISLCNRSTSTKKLSNVSFDFNLGLVDKLSELLSGDQEKIENSLKKGFMIENTAKMPVSTWGSVKRYLASEYFDGGDLESFSSWFKSTKSSNVKLNLRKDKIGNFLKRSFSGPESVSYSANQILNALVHSYVTAIDWTHWEKVVQILEYLVDEEINVCIKANGLNMFYSIRSEDFGEMMKYVSKPTVLGKSAPPACVTEKLEQEEQSRREIELKQAQDIDDNLSQRSIATKENVVIASEVDLPDNLEISPNKGDNMNISPNKGNNMKKPSKDTAPPTVYGNNQNAGPYRDNQNAGPYRDNQNAGPPMDYEQNKNTKKINKDPAFQSAEYFNEVDEKNKATGSKPGRFTNDQPEAPAGLFSLRSIRSFRVPEHILTEEDIKKGSYFALYVGQNEEEQEELAEINKRLGLRSKNFASSRLIPIAPDIWGETYVPHPPIGFFGPYALYNEIKPVMHPDMYDKAGLQKNRMGNPIIPIGQNKKPVVPKDKATGKLLLPVGPQGRPYPLINDNGQVLCCVDVDGEPFVPCDKNGRPVLPLNSEGKPFCSYDDNNTPVYPKGVNGKVTIPLSATGRPVIYRKKEGANKFGMLVVPIKRGGGNLFKTDAAGNIVIDKLEDGGLDIPRDRADRALFSLDKNNKLIYPIDQDGKVVPIKDQNGNDLDVLNLSEGLKFSEVGQPTIPLDIKGNQVYSLDISGRPVIPSSVEGNPMLAIDPKTGKIKLPLSNDGQEMFPTTNDGMVVIAVDPETKQVIIPKDKQGQQLLETNKKGEIVLLKSQDNRPIVPKDDNGNTVLPLDLNGNIVVPRNQFRTIVPVVDMNSETLLKVDHSGAPILEYQNNERPIIQINSSTGRPVNPRDKAGKVRELKNRKGDRLVAIDQRGNPVLVSEPVNKAGDSYQNSYIDDQGNKVYTFDVDADGNVVVPKDACNMPVLPVDKLGRLLLPRDLNNKPVRVENGQNQPQQCVSSTGIPVLFRKNDDGVYEIKTDKSGNAPLLEKNAEGKECLYEDIYGNQVMPVDKDGNLQVPKRKNGTPLIVVDNLGCMQLKTDLVTGRIVNPTYDDKTPIFKTDESGEVILPLDQFGRLIPAKDNNENLLTELVTQKGKALIELWKKKFADEFSLYDTNKAGKTQIPKDMETIDNPEVYARDKNNRAVVPQDSRTGLNVFALDKDGNIILPNCRNEDSKTIPINYEGCIVIPTVGDKLMVPQKADGQPLIKVNNKNQVVIDSNVPTLDDDGVHVFQQAASGFIPVVDQFNIKIDVVDEKGNVVKQTGTPVAAVDKLGRQIMNSDAMGRPVMTKNNRGFFVMKRVTDPKTMIIVPVYPKDRNGNEIVPVDYFGTPIIFKDSTGKLITPKDNGGLDLLKINKLGKLVVQFGENGCPVPQKNNSGINVLPLDKDGNQIKPKDDAGNWIIPVNTMGSPAIRLGPDGEPMNYLDERRDEEERYIISNNLQGRPVVPHDNYNKVILPKCKSTTNGQTLPVDQYGRVVVANDKRTGMAKIPVSNNMTPLFKVDSEGRILLETDPNTCMSIIPKDDDGLLLFKKNSDGVIVQAVDERGIGVAFATVNGEHINVVNMNDLVVCDIDKNKHSVFPNENGMPTYPKDVNGDQIPPVDTEGRSMFISAPAIDKIVPVFDRNGKPFLTFTDNNDIIVQLDKDGKIVIPKSESGLQLINTDENGNFLAPIDTNGNLIFPVDKTGKPIDCPHPLDNKLRNLDPKFDSRGVAVPPPLMVLTVEQDEQDQTKIEKEKNVGKMQGVLQELLTKTRKLDENGKPMELTGEDLLNIAAFGLSRNYKNVLEELLAKTARLPDSVDFNEPDHTEGWKEEEKKRGAKKETVQNETMYSGVMAELLGKIAVVNADGTKGEVKLDVEDFLKLIGVKAKAAHAANMKELLKNTRPVEAGTGETGPPRDSEPAWKQEAKENQVKDNMKNLLKDIEDKVPTIEADIDFHYAGDNRKNSKEGWKEEEEASEIVKDRMKNKAAFGSVLADIIQKVKRIDEDGSTEELTVQDILKATAYLQSARVRSLNKELLEKVKEVPSGVDFAVEGNVENWKEEDKQDQGNAQQFKHKEKFNACLYELLQKVKKVDENGEQEPMDCAELLKAATFQVRSNYASLVEELKQKVPEIPADIDFANTGQPREEEWKEAKRKASEQDETEANKKKFCSVLADILQRKFDTDEDGNKIPLSNEDLTKVLAYQMNASHSKLMDELKSKVPEVEANVEHATPSQEPEWKEAIRKANEQDETEANKKKFGSVLADILQRKFDTDDDGNKKPLSDEDLTKVMAYQMTASHSQLMDELKSKVPEVEPNVEHATPSQEPAWKKEIQQEKEMQKERDMKAFYTGVLGELLGKVKRVDEHGNEMPLSAEELVKIATNKNQLEFKKALNELVTKVPLVEGGIDHQTGLKTKFSKAACVEPHEVNEVENALDGEEGKIEESEYKEPADAPKLKYANVNMALITLIPGVTIPAPPLDLIGADEELNKKNDIKYDVEKKKNLSIFYNVLGELLTNIKPYPDQLALMENDNEEKEWEQEVDRDVMQEKAKMSNVLNDLHQKTNKIHVGDDNEAAGKKIIMKFLYGLSQAIEPHQVTEVVQDDEGVTEHEIEHGVSLEPLKKRPVLTAVGTFQDSLFGGANGDPDWIIQPPHILNGTVMLPPPPTNAGVLESVNKSIVEDLNRAVAVLAKNKHYGMLNELLEKVPRNDDNLCASEGKNIVDNDHYDAVKKMQDLSNIHSVFAELKTRVPKLGENNKPTSKSPEEVNEQIANKWKVQFFQSLNQLVKSQMRKDSQQSNELEKKVDQDKMKTSENLTSVLVELKKKVPEVKAGIDHANVQKAMFAYMQPFVAKEQVDHSGANFEEEVAQEHVSLTAKKQFPVFARAVYGLLDLINRNKERDTSGLPINCNFTDMPHTLTDVHVGRNQGTKDVKNGKQK